MLRFKTSLLVLCGFIVGGCALEEKEGEEAGGCVNITAEEKTLIEQAIQNEIDTSAELIAFKAFRDLHHGALSDVKDQPLFAKYLLKNGGWDSSEATTGVTSFVFSTGSTLTVDVADEEAGSLQIVTPEFEYHLSAKATGGYPAGEIKSASLGEWGVGKGMSAESFGSRKKTLMRFPGGDWEETRDTEENSFSLTYSMPKVQATIWKKRRSGSTETIDITLNGVARCESAETVLTAMFPDVWSILELDW